MQSAPESTSTDGGLLDRLAGVEGLEARELVVALAQQVGHAASGRGRAPRRSSPPRRLPGPRGRDGPLDLGLAGDLDLGEGRRRSPG